MKPPKCRLCESAHWSNEPHVFASNAASNKESASNLIDAVPAMLARVDAAAKVVLASEVAKHCPPAIKQRWAKDKYNAYQRELMRKRRAKTTAA